MSTYSTSSSAVISARPVRSTSSAHWPARSAATLPSPMTSSVLKAYPIHQEHFLAHQRGEAVQIGLLVVSTLAAIVALIVG